MSVQGDKRKNGEQKQGEIKEGLILHKVLWEMKVEWHNGRDYFQGHCIGWEVETHREQQELIGTKIFYWLKENQIFPWIEIKLE